MSPVRPAPRGRRGLTVLGLVLLILALIVAALLVARWLRTRPAATGAAPAVLRAPATALAPVSPAAA
jgi:hypothetical protein